MRDDPNNGCAGDYFVTGSLAGPALEMVIKLRRRFCLGNYITKWLNFSDKDC